MERIVLHNPGCPKLAKADGLHLAISSLDQLVPQIHQLMAKHGLPFYQVVPHNDRCPGRNFPWEDLEYRLFVLEH